MNEWMNKYIIELLNERINKVKKIKHIEKADIIIP